MTFFQYFKGLFLLLILFLFCSDEVDDIFVVSIFLLIKSKYSFSFSDINSSDVEDLWFLSVISCVGTITSSKVYIDTRFSDFLYLKYIKKYKFLKYNFSKENTFYLDAVLFKNELLVYFNESLSILGEIYNEYYRR